jgi:DNA-binding CsgD family transcriptional regulator
MSEHPGLAPWLEVAAEALTSFSPVVRWEAVAVVLREQLHAPLAGTFAWSPAGGARVVGYPRPQGYDLEDVASRAPHHHPLARHYAAHADRAPHATHEFPAERPDVAAYLEELARHDIDQHLWIPLPPSDGHPAVVGACRPADRYTAQELGLAVAVRPLVVALVRHADTLAACPGTAAAAGDELHLTAREVAVLTLCAEGRTTASCARRLGVSPRTVHKHLENAYRKLGVRDRLSAVLRAHAAGVIELPAYAGTRR